MAKEKLFVFQLSKKAILNLGLVVNIILLLIFKYTDFVISNLNFLVKEDIPLLKIVMPLGISFFTITQITYLVDTYEGLVSEINFLKYSLFVTFFPHLLMGPILHHKQMMPQFDSLKTKIFNNKNIYRGIILFAIGLFKKVVIADSLAGVANIGFDVSPSLHFLHAWVTSLSYTFQLYFDFSGYTDMALGCALMLNIVLPINFNSPFKSKSIIEFWKRWHVSLTIFITTYLYTPLLKSFKKFSFSNAMIATVLAMVIAGIWHGAGWSFILFYFLNGLALVINHCWKKTKLKMNPILSWFITFNFINISLAIFRSKNLFDAIKVLKGMMGLSGFQLPHMLSTKLSFLNKFGVSFDLNIAGFNFTVGLLIICFLICLLFKNSNELASSLKPNIKTALFLAIVAGFSILRLNMGGEFLYFNF